MQENLTQNLEEKNPNKRKQLAFIVIGLVILLGFLVVVLFTLLSKRPEEPETTYQRQSFAAYKSNYTFLEDFTITNELNIENKGDNLYKTGTNETDVEKIRAAANLLGLKSETGSTGYGKYVFTKSPEDTVADDNITLNLHKNSLSLAYKNGVNERPFKDEEDSLDYLIDLFGLHKLEGAMYEPSLSKAYESTPNYNHYEYKVNYEGSLLRFEGGADFYASIYLKNKKIVNAKIYLLPKTFTTNTQLEPIQTLGNNLGTKEYTLTIDGKESDDAQYAHAFLQEFAFHPPFKLKLNSYKQNSSQVILVNGENYLLLPLIESRGDFVDSKNNIGTFFLLLVNQE